MLANKISNIEQSAHLLFLLPHLQLKFPNLLGGGGTIFNPRTREAEVRKSLDSRPAWSRELHDSQGYTEKQSLKKAKSQATHIAG